MLSSCSHLLEFTSILPLWGASLLAQRLKHLPGMRETRVRSLGREDPWRRKWQPIPVLLPGESHGRRSLIGYSPWGLKESDTTERLHTFTPSFVRILFIVGLRTSIDLKTASLQFIFLEIESACVKNDIQLNGVILGKNNWHHVSCAFNFIIIQFIVCSRLEIKAKHNKSPCIFITQCLKALY